MWRIESIPPQAGGQHLALKLCRQEVGLGLPFCQLHMSVLRSSEASPQKCPLLTSSQVLLEDQVSIWDPRHLQLKPDFEGKRRPIPLQPAARVQAVPNRRGFVPGEAPGHGAVGNSPREGEATHICLPLHSHGVPPTLPALPGQGRGLQAGAMQPHVQSLATLRGPWGRGTAKGPSPGTRQPAAKIPLPSSGFC